MRLIDIAPFGEDAEIIFRSYGRRTVVPVKEIATVESKETVRCRDCAYFRMTETERRYCANPICGLVGPISLKEEDYCPYGVRDTY